MINILRAESLKYRRNFSRRLILFTPLFFTVIALLQKIFIPDNYVRPWQLFLSQVYNWWPVIFIPLGIALFAALVAFQEKKAGNYYNMKIHNLSPSVIWIGKIVLMAYYTLVSTLILIAVIIITGFIIAGGEIPWIKIFMGGFTMWITSLAVIPLQLWAATWKGMFLSIALGFIGLIAGVIASPKPHWIFVPWSWSIRLMCPIIGIHPNGILLETSDPLRNPSVIPTGICLAVIFVEVFTITTAIWFNRREIR